MSKPRIYVIKSNVHLIREVDGGWEYGVYSDEAGIAWRPVAEGTEWSKMEPFGPVFEMDFPSTQGIPSTLDVE